MADVAERRQRSLIGTRPPVPEAAVEARAVSREIGFPVGWLVAPATLWLLIFLVLPLLSIVVFSFWTATGHGLEPDLTFKHYADYFSTEGFFDPAADKFLTPSVFIKTLGSTLYFTRVALGL